MILKLDLVVVVYSNSSYIYALQMQGVECIWHKLHSFSSRGRWGDLSGRWP